MRRLVVPQRNFFSCCFYSFSLGEHHRSGVGTRRNKKRTLCKNDCFVFAKPNVATAMVSGLVVVRYQQPCRRSEINRLQLGNDIFCLRPEPSRRSPGRSWLSAKSQTGGPVSSPDAKGHLRYPLLSSGSGSSRDSAWTPYTRAGQYLRRCRERQAEISPLKWLGLRQVRSRPYRILNVQVSREHQAKRKFDDRFVAVSQL